MALRSETIEVTGIRCERCVLRLGHVLGQVPGLEAANANLLGRVTLSWDDERVTWDELLAAMARGGFHPTHAE